MQWSHFHWYWRSGRLSFAMVRPFGVGDVVWKKKSDRNYWQIHVKRKSSFLLSTFLQGSGTKSTQHPIFSCLMEPNKTKNGVWFYRFWKEVLDYLVLSRCFSKHRNKGRPAPSVEVSCLCNGDSSFDHVPMDSPSIPRLAGMHQKTSTLHSLPKRGSQIYWKYCIFWN
jgi:hypothetical protein